MDKQCRITLFCEDLAQEYFVRAMIDRVAREEAVAAAIDVANASGGKGKAVRELRAFQHTIKKGGHWISRDMLVVTVDSNDVGWVEQRKAIEAVIDDALWPESVVGCPDPHIEKWCFVDGRAFRTVIGAAPPSVDQRTRDAYKAAFASVVQRAGVFVLTDPMELAPDIVAGLDWGRIAQDRSLDDFASSLRGAFRRWRPED